MYYAWRPESVASGSFPRTKPPVEKNTWFSELAHHLALMFSDRSECDHREFSCFLGVIVNFPCLCGLRSALAHPPDVAFDSC